MAVRTTSTILTLNTTWSLPRQRGRANHRANLFIQQVLSKTCSRRWISPRMTVSSSTQEVMRPWRFKQTATRSMIQNKAILTPKVLSTRELTTFWRRICPRNISSLKKLSLAKSEIQLHYMVKSSSTSSTNTQSQVKILQWWNDKAIRKSFSKTKRRFIGTWSVTMASDRRTLGLLFFSSLQTLYGRPSTLRRAGKAKTKSFSIEKLRFTAQTAFKTRRKKICPTGCSILKRPKFWILQVIT